MCACLVKLAYPRRRGEMAIKRLLLLLLDSAIAIAFFLKA